MAGNPELPEASRERYFTPAEADALLPDVRRHVARAQALIGRGRRLAAAIEQAMEQGGAPAIGERSALVREVQEIQAGLQAEVDALRAMGAEVKGLEPALVDFPALRHGVEVLLCWRQGEERLAWWHPLATGAAGRRPLEETEAGAWEWCN